MFTNSQFLCLDQQHIVASGTSSMNELDQKPNSQGSNLVSRFEVLPLQTYNDTTEVMQDRFNARSVVPKIGPLKSNQLSARQKISEIKDTSNYL